jgi:polyphosphate kinase
MSSVSELRPNYDAEDGVGGDFVDDFSDVTVPDTSDLPLDRYLDRELSWLAFNQRVLELAEDPSIPLLERVNFVAIFASNLDEFFMVRVAGLKRRIVTGIAVPTNIGRSPQGVLEDISHRAHELQERHARVFHDLIKPALDAENIHIESLSDLGDSDREKLDDFFTEQIFPVLMPLAVDPAHPFPYISGLSLNLSVRVRNPKTGGVDFARLKVPPILQRFIPLPDDHSGRLRFIAIEDLISHHVQELFPGMEVLEHHEFRVTRNEDVEIDEDESENLIQALERELLRRRFGPPIRLEITDDMDPVTLNLLISELGITENEVYRLPAPLGLTGLFEISGLDRPDLKYPPHLPLTSTQFLPSEPSEEPDVFRSIKAGDILVHHPYESFATSVQAFLEQAAANPQVLAIKQTLYRTSGDSPIIEALIRAAEAGKSVLALVELKARFDEQANISWAKKLEKAGVHVVYGLVGLKTHCKLALVIKQEDDGTLGHYSHVGTGNYNPKTSRIYEDYGYFTADNQVGKELTRLFNELSGYAIEKKYKKVLVAPRYLRKGLLRRISDEIKNHEAGKPARIRLKLNSLVDEIIIDALYRASMAGVPVEVWVRGICALVPGVQGLSENITVRSVLGRYLEHSRVFWFENAGDPLVYIGSADMMHRNLDRRIEALINITDPAHIEQLGHQIDRGMSDQVQSWSLHSDGTWQRHSHTAEGTPLLDLQHETMVEIMNRKRGAPKR